ncbi:MAG: hypothetical protein WCQ80_04055 [Bacilli bacterium]
MNGRFKVFILFLMMILTVLLTVYITYAWFTVTEKSQPIIISTGSLKQSSRFYVGIDSNYDGVLDDGSYQELVHGGFEVSALIPGQIYTFKIVVINEGTVDGNLSVTMNNIITTNDDILSEFLLSYVNPVTGLTVDKTLDERINQDIDLFLNKTVLKDSGLFEFDFTIEALGTIPSTLRNVNLTITNYIISLVQNDIE